MDNRTRNRIVMFGTIALISAFAFYIRFKYIGVLPLGEKDLYHYYVGQSIFTSGTIQLPSGQPYFRGILQSVFVGISTQLLGGTPTAIRLPSVIFGVGVAIVCFLYLYQADRPIAGLGAATLVAASPHLISFSTTARMYMLAMLVNITAMVALIYIATKYGEDTLPYYRLLGLILTLVIATSLIHRFVFLAAVAAIAVITAHYVRSFESFAELRRVVVEQSGTIGLVVMAAGLFVVFSPINLLSPITVDASQIDFFFVRKLWHRYTLLSLFAVLYISRVAVGFIRTPQSLPSLITTGFFVVPLVAMDLFLPQFYHHKYVVVHLPAFFIVATAGISLACRTTMQWLEVEGEARLRQVTAAVMIFLLVVSLPLGTLGEYNENPDEVEYMGQTSLTDAHKYLDEHADGDDIIISYYPEMTYYYTGQADYYLRQKSYEPFVPTETISGAHTLTTTSELQAVLSNSPEKTVWVIYDREYADNGYISKSSHSLLRKHSHDRVVFRGTAKTVIYNYGDEVIVAKIKYPTNSTPG